MAKKKQLGPRVTAEVARWLKQRFGSIHRGATAILRAAPHIDPKQLEDAIAKSHRPDLDKKGKNEKEN